MACVKGGVLRMEVGFGRRGKLKAGMELGMCIDSHRGGVRGGP